MPPAVVLVTGVSRWLGGALAAELAADPSIGRVIGVDTVPPSPEMLRTLGRTEFVRADIRNPLIGKVIAAASIVDRSAGNVDLGVPYTALIALNFPTYAPDELPADLASVPVSKPGSRAKP